MVYTLKGFKVRLFPTPEQEQLLLNTCDAARYAWNWGLALHMQRFEQGEKFLGAYDMRLRWTKERNSKDFLLAVSSKATGIVLFDLDESYKNFFKEQRRGVKFTKKTIEKAKDRKLTFYDMKAHPKFKVKGRCKVSFPLEADTLTFGGRQGSNGVTIQCVGQVAYSTHIPLNFGRKANKLYNARVSLDGGKWILSFSMDVVIEKPALNSYCAGVDLGVKDLAVVSCNGDKTVISNINKSAKVKKLEKRHRRQQRRTARRQANSNNKLKAQKVESKSARKLRNIRRDYTHKATRKIVDMLPLRIGIEDLNVSGMLKNRYLAKAIHDVNLYEFRRQLEYKASELGIGVVVADMWYPSSKKCSVCGTLKKEFKLSERSYVCSCGAVLDRDYNAARNLELLALSEA